MPGPRRWVATAVVMALASPVVAWAGGPDLDDEALAHLRAHRHTLSLCCEYACTARPPAWCTSYER